MDSQPARDLWRPVNQNRPPRYEAVELKLTDGTVFVCTWTGAQWYPDKGLSPIAWRPITNRTPAANATPAN